MTRWNAFGTPAFSSDMPQVTYYRGLLAQQRRIEAFRRAIRAVVRPEDRVLEVGTGLGTFAFFAADAGAARVWAVEGDPIVHVARAIGKANGYDGRVEFLRGWIPEVELPERATVLLFEDFSPRLLDARVFRLLRTLGERYLEHDARSVPCGARMMLAPVTEGAVTTGAGSLAAGGDTAYGIDWTLSREYVLNEPLREAVPVEALGAAPASIGEISLAHPPDAGALGGAARWQAERDIVIHGLAHWFDLELARGEWLSNAPGAAPASWGQLYLPVEPPVAVAAGQEFTAMLRPERLRDGAPGWLSWAVCADGARSVGHEFASGPASFADLYAESPDAVPRLDPRGRLEARVLQLTDGTRSIGDIAAELRRETDRLDGSEAERFVLRALAGRVERRTLAELSEKEGCR